MVFDDEIEGLFRAINIGVNWLGLVASKTHLSETNVSSTSLGEVYVPWYWSNSRPVCHDGSRANRFPGMQQRLPMKGDGRTTIAEAADSGFDHPWFDKVVFNENLKNVTSTLKLPAYEVPNGYLLLDGNHRAIAAFVNDVAVDLVIIHGPVDMRIIRDLVVFS